MSVASILDPLTGKISAGYLPSNPTTQTITLTSPGTIAFQKTDPSLFTNLSLQPDYSNAQRICVTNGSVMDTLQTGDIQLLGNGDVPSAGWVRLEGGNGGSNFSVNLTSGVQPFVTSSSVTTLNQIASLNGAFPKGLAITSLNTLNGVVYPPESATAIISDTNTSISAISTQTLTSNANVSLTAFDDGSGVVYSKGTTFYYSITPPNTITISANQPPGAGNKFLVNWSVLNL